MNIILAAIKRALRDKLSIISMLFMMIILPSIFSMMFSFDVKIEDVSVFIYAKEKSEIIDLYTDTLENFDKESDDIKIEYKVEYLPNLKSDEIDLESRSEDLQIVIDEDNKNLEFKNSNNMNVGESVVLNVTEAFFNQMTIYEIASSSGNIPKPIDNNIVKTINYEGQEEVNYDSYFGIAMLQMSVLIGSAYAFKNTFYIKQDQGRRVLSSPMKVSKLIILELLGSFIVVAGQAIFLLFLSGILYDVKITSVNILGFISILMALSMLAVSMGILATSIANKKAQGDNIVSAFTLVLVLGSGKLMPNMVSSTESFLYKINPFNWVQDCMMGLLESNSYANIEMAIGVTLVYAVILTVISTLILKKRVVK